MAIYYHCFDLSFSIVILVSFVIAFVSCANVIPGLLLTVSKKTLTFTMTGRKAFSRPWERDCKRLFEDQNDSTSVLFGDWVVSYLQSHNWRFEKVYKITMILSVLFFILIWIGIALWISYICFFCLLSNCIACFGFDILQFCIICQLYQRWFLVNVKIVRRYYSFANWYLRSV